MMVKHLLTWNAYLSNYLSRYPGVGIYTGRVPGRVPEFGIEAGIILT